jgi:CMP-N-acetylneuraminic acid synthetase
MEKATTPRKGRRVGLSPSLVRNLLELFWQSQQAALFSVAEQQLQGQKAPQQDNQKGQALRKQEDGVLLIQKRGV